MGRAGGLGRSMHSGVRGGRSDGGQVAAYHVVSSLFSKSDFTNRMHLGVSMRSGRSQDGIRAVWLLKSPSMAILP